MDLIRPTFNQ